MTIKSILVTVSTPGTAVRATTDESIRAMRVWAQPLHSNTKKSYVGGSDLVGSTGVGLWRHFAGASDAPHSWQYEHGGNPYKVSDFYVDAEVAGEKVLLTYEVL